MEFKAPPDLPKEYLTVTILAQDTSTVEYWANELRPFLPEWAPIAGPSAPLGDVVFVDARMPDAHERLAALERGGRVVFLLVEESNSDAAWRLRGDVNDVLVHPFRALEVAGKLAQHPAKVQWEEVSELNSSLSTIVQRLNDDLAVAERLQQSRLPSRFGEVRGFKVASRYLAGLKSGGDYFDLAESSEGKGLSLVLSDASSYGLSSAILNILMRVALKISVEHARSSVATVQRIREELQLVLGEKDRLSLFYATISRRDYRLRYLNLGTSSAFYASPQGTFRELDPQGGAIDRGMTEITQVECEVELEPGGRLALISDGFKEAVGGAGAVRAVLDRFRGQDAKDALNEFTFRVKSAFQDADDMPAQDCTAVLFDVDPRLMRIA